MGHISSRFTWAVIGLTAVGALTFPASVQGQLLDDFSDGDDVGWTRFTNPWGLPGADWDASTGVYRLSAKEFPGGAAVLGLLDSTADPHFSNGYWWATVVRETGNSWSNLLMRGDLESLNAYQFACHPSLGLFIAIIEGGEHRILASDLTIVQAVGTEYIMEAGAIGSFLELRMWPLGDPRPELPQVSHTDSTYASGVNGIAAAAVSDGDLSATFDDVCFMWRDDFNDGDDDGWTHWTLPPDLPGATWEVDPDTFVYRLSAESVPRLSVIGSFPEITADPSFSNGYWRATVVRENEDTVTALVMRADLEAVDAYLFVWDDVSGLFIGLVYGGDYDVLDNDPNFVQEVGTEYIMEAGAFGCHLELRMWPLGDERPELPQCETTNSTYAFGTNGVLCRVASDGALSATFDDVCFVFVEPILGDLNGDGCVDQADLGILLADWGCTGGDCPGDCDGDGDTDHSDLGILLAHWGEGCP